METTKRKYMESYLADLRQGLASINLDVLEHIIELMIDCGRSGRFVWVIGNGGSALTASHLAVDLGKGASYGKENRFRVLALTESIGTITAYGNDTTYADIFVEQLKNLVQPGDLLVAISGSGNSENVLQAVDFCNNRGVTTIGLTGKTGGRLAQKANCVFQAATDHMGRIEDLHLIVVHLLTYFFMETDTIEGW